MRAYQETDTPSSRRSTLSFIPFQPSTHSSPGGRPMTGANTERLRDPMGLYRLGYAGSLLEYPTVRWEEGARTEQDERIVEETPVAIVYNGIPHVVMMATPADLEDFALGFSLTEELIQSPGGPRAASRSSATAGASRSRRPSPSGARRSSPSGPGGSPGRTGLRHLRRGRRGRGAQANPSGDRRGHHRRRRGSARARGAGRQPAAQRRERRGARRRLGPAPTARSS